MIVILDYGMGNAGSIKNMLRKIGAEAVISASEKDILSADKLVVPGVGAFDHGMSQLKALSILESLEHKVIKEKTPTIGICLGMQLFTEKSEEGNASGLGWFQARTERFKFEGDQKSLKIPHMGWNLFEARQSCPLFHDFDPESRFYFVHSYHVTCDREEDVLGVTQYGYPFASVIKKDNIIGVQFHPEKSHRFGMKLLQNFVELF